MATQQTISRRRVSPSMPFSLAVETDGGAKELMGFRLNYDFNAMVLVEEKTGFNGLSGAIFSSISMTNLSIIFWAMCQANHPETAGDEGLADLRSLMTARNKDSVVEATQECWLKNLPDADAERIRKAIEQAKKDLEEKREKAAKKEADPADPTPPAV